MNVIKNHKKNEQKGKNMGGGNGVYFLIKN